MTHPALTPPIHTENCELNVVCPCGSSCFFYSEMEPSGYFCVECGTPDPITQRRLETEEPGYWGL
jgi:hypothetical protein